MIIIEIIMLLFPGMLAADYYQKIGKDKFQGKNYIIDAIKFVLWINFIEIAGIYVRGWHDFSFEYISAGLILKYMGLGIALAYIFPYVYKGMKYIVGRYITGSIKPE